MADLKLHVEKIRQDARLPFYAHEGDAGMDVCAAEDCLLAPGETKAVPTGLIFHIPRGFELQVRPRSGLSLKTPLRIPNSPGTIDSGYKDELCVILWNSSTRAAEDGAALTCDEKQGRQGAYRIRKGDRIAQLVVARVACAEICAGGPADAAGQVADRGGGFGHSGMRAEAGET